MRLSYWFPKREFERDSYILYVLFVCACVCLFVVISLCACMHALLHIPTEHFHYWGFLVSLYQCEKPIGYNLHLAG